jgi:pyrroline-5-carboxylate reductase
MSAWHSENLSEDENYTVRKMLQALGLEQYFEEERFLDMATALSGTGPAYIFLLAESMIDSGVNMGLPREKAKILTY